MTKSSPRKLRATLGWTQRAVAEYFGMSTSYIRHMEDGSKNVHPFYLDALRWLIHKHVK